MEKNKKVLILSILGVLVLIIAVVGVSFAMYSFTGTGTKENYIRTGKVTINYWNEEGTADSAPTLIALTNEYPKTDAIGSQTGEKLTFSVAADMPTGAKMDIKYDLGVVPTVVDGATLTDQYIKFNLAQKTTPEATQTYLLGTADTGILLSGRKTIAGTYNLINEYAIASGVLNEADPFDSYVLTAWVDENYDLVQGENVVTGDTQTNTSTPETFTFKLKISASDR